MAKTPPERRYLLPLIIEALRRSTGRTQTALAQELSVSPSAVNQVEKPDTPVQETVFVRYAEALGYSDEREALEAGLRILRRQEQLAARQKAATAKRGAASRATDARSTPRRSPRIPRRRIATPAR